MANLNPNYPVFLHERYAALRAASPHKHPGTQWCALVRAWRLGLIGNSAWGHSQHARRQRKHNPYTFTKDDSAKGVMVRQYNKQVKAIQERLSKSL